jgi:PEP-CTERM motif
MKKYLLGTALLLSLTLPAKADIVLFGLSDILSFRDVGAQGFGDFHRALTLQTNGLEFGARGFGNTQIDQAINGADKGNTPTLGQLGWTSGFNVGIGFNTDQAGQKDGITMQALNLTVWDLAGNAVFTAGLATSPINFSAAALALQQGNGNAVFDFELNAAERAEFNAMLASHPGNSLFTVGLGSVLGCGAGAPATCLKADDGPDSFVLFNQTIAAVPETSTWAMMLLGFAGVGLFGLRNRRKFRLA